MFRPISLCKTSVLVVRDQPIPTSRLARYDGGARVVEETRRPFNDDLSQNQIRHPPPPLRPGRPRPRCTRMCGTHRSKRRARGRTLDRVSLPPLPLEPTETPLLLRLRQVDALHRELREPVRSTDCPAQRARIAHVHVAVSGAQPRPVTLVS